MYFARLAFVLCVAAPGVAQSSTVEAGPQLLDAAGQAQLQSWIGLGDQGFTRIWRGVAGSASAESFHVGVDGMGPTVSIFQITLYDGSSALIGGHSTIDWGTESGFHADSQAFIFNLTEIEIQRPSAALSGLQAVYTDPAYFSTFGGGHDLFAGIGTLGVADPGSNIQQDGYSASYSYDTAQGQIAIHGDSGGGWGNSGYGYDAWRVEALEVYSYAAPEPDPVPAPMPVPLPAGLPLLLAALIALRLRR
ncbi:PEP_CTERM-anchored TLD domain-containing protein [Citreicella sp. C3M06]|uniref:PEP_CTERM-anchored TLD domain-containing protein n=1 Tax=Citreicella sp. C3M06 TaxID=2841564 RepID=UPI001C091CAF|nr:PEP_CTERM-anchored TLD domain-containing protein [Citreicella sp. C3M06]MBU2963399.1 PEP_CTERM-anchored TLD domain-containing protein [Citreicella sp. C3M06]